MENTISVHLWVKLYIIFVSRALAVVISGHFCRNAVSFTTAECYYLLCSLHRFIACIPRYPKVTGLSKKCWDARLVDFGEPLLLGSWYLSVHVMHLKPNCRIHGSRCQSEYRTAMPRDSQNWFPLRYWKNDKIMRKCREMKRFMDLPLRSLIAKACKGYTRIDRNSNM